MKNYIFAGITGLLLLSSFFLGYRLGTHYYSLDQRLKADISSAFLQTSSSSTASTAATSTASSSLSAVSSTATLPIAVSLLTSSSSPVNLYAINKRLQYKMILNVDPCTIEKLSNSGWQIFQMGSVTSDLLNFGYDVDCQSRAGIGIDWVILERERQ